MKMIHEMEKKAGVSYVIAKNGLELPVIDITHPAFTAAPDEKQLRELERGLDRPKVIYFTVSRQQRIAGMASGKYNLKAENLKIKSLT